MTWSFPVGRILGTEVRIHATFFLLLLWIGVAGFARRADRGDAIVSLLFILALFACVVLHEFGHALMARRFGISRPTSRFCRSAAWPGSNGCPRSLRRKSPWRLRVRP